MSWWRSRRASSTDASCNTGASSQRSRPVPRSVVLDVLVLLSWCRRPSRVFLRSSRWVQMSTVPPSPGSPPRALALVARSSSSCGRWFLSHWRYPQSTLSRWYLRLLADRWPRKLLLQSLPPHSRNHRLTIH